MSCSRVSIVGTVEDETIVDLDFDLLEEGGANVVGESASCDAGGWRKLEPHRHITTTHLQVVTRVTDDEIVRSTRRDGRTRGNVDVAGRVHDNLSCRYFEEREFTPR